MLTYKYQQVLQHLKFSYRTWKRNQHIIDLSELCLNNAKKFILFKNPLNLFVRRRTHISLKAISVQEFHICKDFCREHLSNCFFEGLGEAAQICFRIFQAPERTSEFFNGTDNLFMLLLSSSAVNQVILITSRDALDRSDTSSAFVHFMGSCIP